MKSDLSFVYIYGMLKLHHKNNNYFEAISEIDMILHYLCYFPILQIENLHLNFKLSKDHKAKGDVG
jgi:hypothetical protein